MVIWFFGYSGSGKTTLSMVLSEHFKKKGVRHIVLDGDLVRQGINKGLGFTREDRKENTRRLAEICKLMLSVDIVPIVAAITPYQMDRAMVLEILGPENVFMVHVDCPLNVCEQRDPKGLYQLARKGEIANFTGVSDIFDPPGGEWAYKLKTDGHTIERCLELILKHIKTS